MMISRRVFMGSVGVKLKNVDDVAHWYCFECTDFKPPSGTALSAL